MAREIEANYLTINYLVVADNARPSDCLAEGVVGWDADVEVYLGDVEAESWVVRGQVTLCPHEVTGQPSMWGAMDNWMSDQLCELVRKLGNPLDLIHEVEAAARKAIDDYVPEGVR